MRKIVKEAEGILEKAGYNFCENFGCFDIVAKKGDNLFLVKMLSNVDSLQEEHATNLKNISLELGASAFIIGERTRKERLKGEIVYQRYDIPTVSIDALESISSNKFSPVLSRNKGGIFMEINSGILREMRQKMGLTQQELAEKCQTTKKNIYEHEKRNKKASKQLVRRLETILGKISMPVRFIPKKNEKEEPKGWFENRVVSQFNSMGFETNFVNYAPFNIIARKENILILSEAQEDRERLEKIVSGMINFSHVAERPIIAITREELELRIPSISEKNFGEFSSRDIEKIAKSTSL